MNSKTIWMEKQNKPTYVVEDIKKKYFFISRDFIYKTLLRRGVFKWLSVRRDLIKLKDKWKGEVRKLNRKKTEKEKGYLHALEKCRKEIRKLCRSERWIAPDFDSKANEYLKRI